MSDASESKAFLHDLRALIEKYYGSNGYSFHTKYFELAVVNSFGLSMVKQLIVALSTVTLVVLFITFNVRVTVFIVFVVLLVVLYIAGTIHFWGLTLNNVTGMNMIFALGISIDYSVHIAHKYLLIKPTKAYITKS